MDLILPFKLGASAQSDRIAGLILRELSREAQISTIRQHELSNLDRAFQRSGFLQSCLCTASDMAVAAVADRICRSIQIVCHDQRRMDR